jgi:hypothetical protein
LSAQALRRRIRPSELLVQAEVAARFVDEHGRSEPDGLGGVRVGLDVLGDPALAGPIADEIRELAELVRQACVRLRATYLQGTNRPLLREGIQMVQSLRATLRWAARASMNPAEREGVLRALSMHRRPRSMDAVAMALVDLAAVVEDVAPRWPYVARRGLSLDRARAMGEALRAAESKSRRRTEESARALEERDRLAVLLIDRVQRVRAAARLVWKVRWGKSIG